MLKFKVNNGVHKLQYKGITITQENYWSSPTKLLTDLKQLLLPSHQRVRGILYRGQNMGFLVINNESFRELQKKTNIIEQLTKPNKKGQIKIDEKILQELEGKILKVTEGSDHFTLTMECTDKSIVIFQTNQIVLEWNLS